MGVGSSAVCLHDPGAADSERELCLHSRSPWQQEKVHRQDKPYSYNPLPPPSASRWKKSSEHSPKARSLVESLRKTRGQNTQIFWTNRPKTLPCCHPRGPCVFNSYKISVLQYCFPWFLTDSSIQPPHRKLKQYFKMKARFHSVL